MHHEAGVCGQGGDGRSHLFSGLQLFTVGENDQNFIDQKYFFLTFLKISKPKRRGFCLDVPFPTEIVISIHVERNHS